MTILPAQPDQIGPPADLEPRVNFVLAPDDGAMRYLALQQRVFFEMLGGIERQFGREHAVEIVTALSKKYPAE